MVDVTADKIPDDCACKTCIYCEGVDEYEENCFAIFCAHPEARSYLEGTPKTCKSKISRES